MRSLVEAFRKDEDIHARTASEIFGVSLDQVTAPMRREAKVINFGIIYGMSAYGLSQQLGVDPKVAQAYIDEYFKKYTGVQAYIEKSLEEARQGGLCHDASPAAPLPPGHPFPRCLHPAGGRENGDEHPSSGNGSRHH